eukprot:gene11401-23854_t
MTAVPPPKFVVDACDIFHSDNGSLTAECLRKAKRNVNEADTTAVIRKVWKEIILNKYQCLANNCSDEASIINKCLQDLEIELTDEESSSENLLLLSSLAIKLNLWRDANCASILESYNVFDGLTIFPTTHTVRLPSSVPVSSDHREDSRPLSMDSTVYRSGRIAQKLKALRNMDITRARLLRSLLRLQAQLPLVRALPPRAMLSLQSPLDTHGHYVDDDMHGCARLLVDIDHIRQLQLQLEENRDNEVMFWKWMEGCKRNENEVEEDQNPSHSETGGESKEQNQRQRQKPRISPYVSINNKTKTKAQISHPHTSVEKGIRNTSQSHNTPNKHHHNTAHLNTIDLIGRDLSALSLSLSADENVDIDMDKDEDEDSEIREAWRLLRQEAALTLQSLGYLEEAALYVFLTGGAHPLRVSRLARELDQQVLAYNLDDTQARVNRDVDVDVEDVRFNCNGLNMTRRGVLRGGGSNALRDARLRGPSAAALRSHWTMPFADADDALAALRLNHDQLLKRTATACQPFSPFRIVRSRDKRSQSEQQELKK